MPRIAKPFGAYQEADKIVKKKKPMYINCLFEFFFVVSLTASAKILFSESLLRKQSPEINLGAFLQTQKKQGSGVGQKKKQLNAG